MYQVTQLTKHIFYHCSYIYPTFTSSDRTHQAYLQPLQLPTFTLCLHQVTELTKHIFNHCSYLHSPYVYIEWPNSPSISSTTAVTYIYPTFTSSDPIHQAHFLPLQLPTSPQSDPTHQAYLLPLQLPTFTLHLYQVTHTPVTHADSLTIRYWYLLCPCRVWPNS